MKKVKQGVMIECLEAQGKIGVVDLDSVIRKTLPGSSN